MRNFYFTIKETTILQWENLASSLNRPMGGILIVSSDDGGPVDERGLRAMPIYWNRIEISETDRNPASFYIPGFSTIRPDSDDASLLATLRGPGDQGSGPNFITPDLIDIDPSALWPGNNQVPAMDFKLAFLDFSLCKFFAYDDSYYYRSGSRLYQGPKHPSIPNLPRTRINPEERGIVFSRGISIFDGSTVSSIINQDKRPGIVSYNTLVAKPYPEPILVDGNQAGAVAYALTPSCPPFWKPGRQYLVTGAMFRSSAAASPVPEK